jgi:hypothetical protein
MNEERMWIQQVREVDVHVGQRSREMDGLVCT